MSAKTLNYYGIAALGSCLVPFSLRRCACVCVERRTRTVPLKGFGAREKEELLTRGCGASEFTHCTPRPTRPKWVTPRPTSDMTKEVKGVIPLLRLLRRVGTARLVVVPSSRRMATRRTHRHWGVLGSCLLFVVVVRVFFRNLLGKMSA